MQFKFQTLNFILFTLPVGISCPKQEKENLSIKKLLSEGTFGVFCHSRAHFFLRQVQTKGRDSVSNHKVDRLVLHQSSPSSSLSNVPPLEQDVGLHQKPGGDVATPAELQRPETSRGRQSRTSSARLKEAKSPSPSQESLAEDKSSRRDSRSAAKSGRQRETCSLENRSQSEAEVSEEALEVDLEVAEERERLKEAKERRLRLLREELRREEEEEERKLKEEAEERRR